MIITLQDALKRGHCPGGVKRWFGQHNLDFRHFVKNGIDSDLVIKLGDGFGDRVVKLAKERQGDGS
ncbi:MAG: hypothetical protein OEQ29_09560 [Alphaproteobacteria bacterium]|nr:hypothetical protein [Alphaproteobacteria bacterium]